MKKEEEKSVEGKKTEENILKVKDKKKEEAKIKEKTKKKEEIKIKDKNMDKKSPLNKEINHKNKDNTNINKNIKEKFFKKFKLRPIKTIIPQKIKKYKSNTRSKFQTTDNNYIKTPLSPQPKKIKNIKNLDYLNTDNKLVKDISRHLDKLCEQKMNTEDNISHKNKLKKFQSLFWQK